jgi:hypothetical protein
MKPESLFAVITTIQPPTGSVRALADCLARLDGRLIVIGDKKGPAAYDVPGVDFWSLGRQLEAGFQLGARLPVGHYSRKNIGYLAAIAAGANCIYETDDDNAPLPTWQPRTESTPGSRIVEKRDAGQRRWVNVYRYFSDENIWPRGFALDEIGAAAPALESRSESWTGREGQAHFAHGASQNEPVPAGSRTETRNCWAPIQQGLVDGSPDVDAIWRLTQDRPFEFDRGESVLLEPGNWCPFNSQTTWWWPAAYPLLYIPSYCPFRMCDIWRSFVAQRCLWELGSGLCFHGAEVVQERNEHDLMRDFEDEVAGYRWNKRFTSVLEAVRLDPDANAIAGNVRTCYEALVADGLFPVEELGLVDAWLADLPALVSQAGA